MWKDFEYSLNMDLTYPVFRIGQSIVTTELSVVNGPHVMSIEVSDRLTCYLYSTPTDRLYCTKA
jgi:hypothetical protein